MASLLIFLSLTSGVISFAVLWPYGLFTSLIGAPLIASLMTFLAAILIRPMGRPHAVSPAPSAGKAGDLGLNE
jgi:hypothetical protein